MSDYTLRLRKAARVLRERAEEATPGPWEAVPTTGNAIVAADGDGYWTDVADRIEAPEDATFIATMHPGVALALADWLPYLADALDRHGATLAEADEPALRIADLLLGVP